MRGEGHLLNGQNRAVYLVKRMCYRYFADGIPQAAAELSFFLLFSIFPLLMFVNSLLAQLHLSIDGLMPVLDLLPESLKKLIVSYLSYIALRPSVSPMVIGIVMSLYFLSRAVRSMMRTVNNIYHIEVRRSIPMNVLISFGITAGFLVSVVLSFALVVAGGTVLRLVLQYLPIPPQITAFINRLQNATYLVTILFLFGFLMLFNRVVPNLRLKFREVWPGAMFSLAAWMVVSWLFAIYVDTLSNYSAIYGSLSAIMVLMLWLYIVSMILLMGPQLNHTLTIMRLYRLETAKHIH